MIIPIVLSIIFNISIIGKKGQEANITLSVYGIYIIFYMNIQILFSFLNRRKIQKIYEKNTLVNGKYNILAVGYKEDPILFEKCLKSIASISNIENINKIFIVIDGNENDDQYMAEIAKQVLDAKIINFSNLTLSNLTLSNFSEKIYCILQPHKGKRHALYTGLKLSCIQKTDGVLCTDSDTELHSKSLYYLANLLESDSNYGAVTGNVKISNNNTSIISFLSSLRYWFACNLERAYQSYNGCVLCVSGPLGLYRTEYLEQFLELWLNQKFLENKCTYGDDRHLTNNMLLLGKKIGYTHLAECLTDTPESIQKFFNQQVRWCKSSFREFIWNTKCLKLHSFWMTIDLIYQILYSFIVLATLIYILYFGSIFQLVFYFTTLLLFNAIKGIYAVIIERSAKYLLFTFYGLIYISLLAPAKVYAGMTMKDINWGTNSIAPNIYELKHLFLLAWNCIIISGIIYNVVM
jgi:hyaluronan synthase